MYTIYNQRKKEREKVRAKVRERVKSLYSLLSTINQLILIGSLEAGPYSLVMPQDLCVFIKFLPRRWKKTEHEKRGINWDFANNLVFVMLCNITKWKTL